MSVSTFSTKIIIINKKLWKTSVNFNHKAVNKGVNPPATNLTCVLYQIVQELNK